MRLPFSSDFAKKMLAKSDEKFLKQKIVSKNHITNIIVTIGVFGHLLLSNLCSKIVLEKKHWEACEHCASQEEYCPLYEERKHDTCFKKKCDKCFK